MDKPDEVSVLNIIHETDDLLKKIPKDDPHRACLLTNLANSLQDMYERTGSTDHLDAEIRVRRKAARLTINEPGQGCRLNNLGNALYRRFETTKSMDDLNEAIQAQRDSMNLTPENHPHRATHLQCLYIALQSLFDENEMLDILDEMISVQKNITQLKGNRQVRADR